MPVCVQAVNLVRTAQADQERLAAEQQLRQAQLKAAEAERRHREATDSAAKKMEQAKKREEAQRWAQNAWILRREQLGCVWGTSTCTHQKITELLVLMVKAKACR